MNTHKKCSLCNTIGHNRRTCQSYDFGPNKFFTGSNEEWNILKNKQPETISIYNTYIKVKCCHCGSINTHIGEGHRICDGWSKTLYDCPGYFIG